MKVLIARWEDNGYHDSYFYASVWDSVSKTMSDIMEGATAFCGGETVDAIPLKSTSSRIKAAFRKWACHRTAEMIHAAEVRDCLEPKTASHGAELVTLRDVCPRKSAVIPKGTVGKVFWVGSFKPSFVRACRDNIRVGIETTAGEKHFVALSACRLNKEPESFASIHKTIIKRYDAGDFSVVPLTGCKAWLSDCYIK